MNKEKLIKQQAREALKGNLSSLMAAMGMITLCVTTLITLFLLLVIALRIIDIDSDELKAGMELPLLGVYALCGLPGVACLPMVNGFMRMSGDAVIKGSCELSELFYFYRRPLRFFKSVVVDMGLIVLFSAIAAPADVAVRLLENSGDLFVILASVVSVIWKLLIFIFFIRYPRAAFALDDSRGIFRYLFCYIGFSFRHCGALIRLLLSMLGWIALCFFVVPAVYSIPYLEVALMNSARWLLPRANRF